MRSSRKCDCARRSTPIAAGHSRGSTMSGSGNSNELPPAWQFHQLMTSYYVPQAIYVAAQLGLADHLARNPQTAGELARATATDPAALNLLLYALSSIGIFTAAPNGIWQLTPLATYLQSDTPTRSAAGRYSTAPSAIAPGPS